MIATVTYAGGDQAQPYTQRTLAFDQAGRPTQTRFSIPGSAPRFFGTGNDYTVSATYTATGVPATVSVPAVGGLPAETLSYGYRDDGQPTSMKGLDAYVTGVAYSPTGQVNGRVAQRGAGTDHLKWAMFYDPEMLWLTESSMRAEIAGVLMPYIDTTTFVRDRRTGQISRAASSWQTAGVGVQSRTMCYRYDILQQLTAAWSTPSAADPVATNTCQAGPGSGVGGTDPVWQEWSFYSDGQRAAVTDYQVPGRSRPTTTTFYDYGTPGHAHALAGTTTRDWNGAVTGTESFQYDPTGATTTRTGTGATTRNQQFTWAATGRAATITTGTGTSSYLFDADGTQRLRTDPGGTTLYLGDVELTIPTNTTTVKGTRSYTFAGGKVAVRTATALTAMYADPQGTATIAISWSNPDQRTRRTYDPYGSELTTTNTLWPTTRGYQDQPANTHTGLTDMGVRLYDPAHGIFLSTDPVLDPTSPISLSAYPYTNNDPINQTDSSGLSTKLCADDCSAADTTVITFSGNLENQTIVERTSSTELNSRSTTVRRTRLRNYTERSEKVVRQNVQRRLTPAPPFLKRRLATLNPTPTRTREKNELGMWVTKEGPPPATSLPSVPEPEPRPRSGGSGGYCGQAGGAFGVGFSVSECTIKNSDGTGTGVKYLTTSVVLGTPGASVGFGLVDSKDFREDQWEGPSLLFAGGVTPIFVQLGVAPGGWYGGFSVEWGVRGPSASVSYAWTQKE